MLLITTFRLLCDSLHIFFTASDAYLVHTLSIFICALFSAETLSESRNRTQTNCTKSSCATLTPIQIEVGNTFNCITQRILWLWQTNPPIIIIGTADNFLFCSTCSISFCLSVYKIIFSCLFNIVWVIATSLSFMKRLIQI